MFLLTFLVTFQILYAGELNFGRVMKPWSLLDVSWKASKTKWIGIL